VEDLSVILLGGAAIAAGVVLATAQQRQAGGVTPTARIPGRVTPAGITPTPTPQRTVSAAQLQSPLKSQVLRGMGQAGRLPTIRQRTIARNIAKENMRQFCLRYPEQCCGKVGDPGGYGMVGFG